MSKKLFFLTALFGLGIGLGGCSTEPESIIETNNGGISIDRETFKQRVEARLHDFEIKLEELRNKAIEVRVEIREKLHEDIEELRRKETAARDRMARMWQNGAERFDEDKEHLEAALEELKVGFEKAFSRLTTPQ